MYLITGILICIFLFSFYKEPRRLRNGILFIFVLGFSYLSIMELMNAIGLTIIMSIMVLFLIFGIPFIIFISGFFLIGNGIILLRKEGFSKANLLSTLLGGVVLGFFGIIGIKIYHAAKGFSHINDVYSHRFFIENTIFIYLILAYFIFGFMFFSFLFYSILYNWYPKNKDYDFVIIHGAGLLEGERVTPLLKARIDKGVEAYYRGTKKEKYLIASGGRGDDEKISEARAIYNYLMEIDFPKENIILEETSTTTYENLLYSFQIGKERMTKPKFLFVTNDYHVFRTSMFARKIGMKGSGLGCKTAGYYLPSAFIREYIALIFRFKWYYIALFTLFTIFYILIQ